MAYIKVNDLNKGIDGLQSPIIKFIPEDKLQGILQRVKAKNGDIIEIGLEVVRYGYTSITVRCLVRNKITQTDIISIDKIVFVHLDENGRPSPHGVTEST